MKSKLSTGCAIWWLFIFIVIASRWGSSNANSMTGNFDSCQISCSSNNQQHHHQENILFPSASETTTIVGKKGPKGDQGSKGEPGSPGTSCHCRKLTEQLRDMEEKYERLKEALTKPTSCYQIKSSNSSAVDGVYTIYPVSPFEGLSVRCDMTSDGGGWTVFQKRQDGSIDFDRDWKYYDNGFGDKNGEYWLGLKNIRDLVKRKQMELRIDLTDHSNNHKYALYKDFKVGPGPAYILTYGQYCGTAGDALSLVHRQHGMAFTTKDYDQDRYSGNCAARFRGGWWFNDCFRAHLNGLYSPEGDWTGVIWYTFKDSTYSLKTTEMKVREM